MFEFFCASNGFFPLWFLSLYLHCCILFNDSCDRSVLFFFEVDYFCDATLEWFIRRTFRPLVPCPWMAVACDDDEVWVPLDCPSLDFNHTSIFVEDVLEN